MQGLNILGKNPLQNAFPYAIILLVKHTWGYSSAGRALEWHSRGQRFDPAYLHQKKEVSLFLKAVKPLLQYGKELDGFMCGIL